MEIQLAIAINFGSSKDSNKEWTMHSKGDDIEVMTYDRLDENIEELFELLLFWHKIGLETQMRGSDFIFDCVDLLYCKFVINFDEIKKDS